MSQLFISSIISAPLALSGLVLLWALVHFPNWHGIFRRRH